MQSDGGQSAQKLQYIRELVLKLLMCSEIEVKHHMETALMALLRCSNEERQRIENRRKSEGVDPIVDPLVQGIESITCIFTGSSNSGSSSSSLLSPTRS